MVSRFFPLGAKYVCQRQKIMCDLQKAVQKRWKGNISAAQSPPRFCHARGYPLPPLHHRRAGSSSWMQTCNKACKMCWAVAARARFSCQQVCAPLCFACRQHTSPIPTVMGRCNCWQSDLSPHLLPFPVCQSPCRWPDAAYSSPEWAAAGVCHRCRRWRCRRHGSSSGSSGARAGGAGHTERAARPAAAAATTRIRTHI